MDSECLKLNETYLLKIMFGAAEIRNNSIVLSNSSKYAIKKNGGEIAIIEDSLMTSSFVKIYTSIGELLASIPVFGQVASIGWSHREELLETVFVDGYLQVYTEDFGNYKEFQILTKESNEKIIEAQFFEDSSTISLTSDNRFIKLDLFDLKLFEYLIPECLEFNSPQCWTISRDESILFAQSSDVFKLSTNDELTKKQIPYKTICHMSVNENELIILTIDSRLIVLELNNNFQVKYDVNVGYDVEIFCVNGVDWLNSSIAVISQSASGKLHLVDLYSGQVLQLQFSKNFITEKEVDGIRVISQNNNCLITKMPTILVDLNYKSSSESIVSEFYDRYIKNELEEIRKFPLAKLVEIIDLCAKTLPQLTYQKSLRTNLQMALKISREFLKDHLNNDDNSRQTFTYLTAMTQMSFAKCTSLDNIISHGVSISPLEFEDPRVIERLLTRLCRRNLYYLAFEIAVLLELDLTVIIMNWARQGILKSDKIIDDETLWYLISDKIFTWSSHRAINLDFFELAHLALNNNRLKLSRKLINLESNNRKKIELLAALPDHRVAIIESIKTGSQDQINFIFDCLYKKLNLVEFLNLTNISNEVRNAFYTYCESNDHELMKILLYQDDKLTELLRELILINNSNELESLEKWFQLLRVQRCFEKRTELRLVGKSSSETFYELNKLNTKASRDFSESIK